jgi:hypothetical protein
MGRLAGMRPHPAENDSESIEQYSGFFVPTCAGTFADLGGDGLPFYEFRASP